MCFNNVATLKDLVRTRQYITKFIEMRSHLQGVALKLQTVKSHQAMAEAMQSTAVAMKKMNKAVNVQTIKKMLAEFEKENARTEMTQEGKARFFVMLLFSCRTMVCCFYPEFCNYYSVPQAFVFVSNG